VKDLEIADLLPIHIEEVTILLKGGRREITLSDTMNGERFTNWKKRKGGAFYKDVFEYSRGREHGKYVEITGPDIDYIARLIEDEELENFTVRRLVHGKIKDKPFMILENRSDIEESDEEDGYIEETGPEDPENEVPIMLGTPNIPIEDDDSNSGKSISLFD
jgi:hypothetical protein